MAGDPGRSPALTPPPLSLYVHLPWCLSKCPYCDFNSHAPGGDLPLDRYVEALLRDLDSELPLIWGRTLQTVFLGGGTPSLFNAEHIGRLLSGIRARLALAPGAEVTMEANPGALEHDRLGAYLEAGVNRISLGVQSFDDQALRRLGRIHRAAEAASAVAALREAGCDNFNLDLMFALPEQRLDGALTDVERAIEMAPPHISHYQLTLEPNTAFYANPPALPGEELAWEMQEACAERLIAAGYLGYEVSAWSRAGRECRHNLNYWAFGDYVGIGAGAHGKLTLAAEGAIRRRARVRHPRAWMEAVEQGAGAVAEDRPLAAEDRVFEFFLNALRLRGGFRVDTFEQRTGLPWSAAERGVDEAVQRGLLQRDRNRLVPTELGWRFCNDLQALFLP